MGMFDYVKFKAKCRKCGKVLTSWQTKDGPQMMTTLEAKEVRSFYTDCPKCETWNEYNVVAKEFKIVLDKKANY